MAAFIKSPQRVLAVALALGWAFDLLFYGKWPGLSVLLFVLMTVAALVAVVRLEGVAPVVRNSWLAAPLVFFAAMVAVRANIELTLLNILACLSLLMLLAYFYAAGRVERLGLFGYPLAMLATVSALFWPALVVGESIQRRTPDRRNVRRFLPVLRGLIVALPIGVVFVALLASADMVFARYIGALLNLDFLLSLQEVAGHGVVAVVVGWLAAGGLAFALWRASSKKEDDDSEPWDRVGDAVPNVLHIGAVEGATVLVVVNAIFLVFGWIQFSYLFGGQANIAAEGFTYAEYARRGFFELIAVSLLTLGLILGLHWLTWRETRRQALAFKGLATLLVGLTLVLLWSAFWRMALYEEAYGYTSLRLYVHIFEIWLAVLFGWVVVTLWWRPKQFAIGACAAAIGFVATLNLINPDALIAEQNLTRYTATGQVDMYYLASLSEDAVPVLLRDSNVLTTNDRDWLMMSLRERLAGMEANHWWLDIPSLNVSRLQAYGALSASQQQLAGSGAPVSSPPYTDEGRAWLP